MSLNLNYRSIQTNLFIKIDIPGYQVLTFSDYHKAYTLNGQSYTGLGQLLAVSNSSSNLRASNQEMIMSISGIPSNNIPDILNHKIKGSKVSIYRAFFDPATGDFLNISGNPSGKFQGIINNYSIADDLEMGADTGTVTLTLTATSVVDMLNNKITGRRTNPTDEKVFFPNDLSMDRVPALIKSNFNFGAPQ